MRFPLNNKRYLKYLWVLGAVLLFACPETVSCGFAAEDITVQWIDVSDLGTVLRDRTPVIVDLRTPREFKGGHLAGAVNIPIENLIRRHSQLDDYRDKPVLLYCRTVNKTRRAIWLLQERGFKSIYALWGGYEGLKIHKRGAELPQ
jgi:rhodanese-related sulfurtransferase